MAPSIPLEPRSWLMQYDPQVPPKLDYPLMPIYNLLDETAASRPDRPCVNFLGRRFTYQQITESSDHAPIVASGTSQSTSLGKVERKTSHETLGSG